MSVADPEAPASHGEGMITDLSDAFDPIPIPSVNAGWLSVVTPMTL